MPTPKAPWSPSLVRLGLLANSLLACVATAWTPVAQTPRSPTLFLDLQTSATAPPRSSTPASVFSSAGTAWFTATTPGTGHELWSTDGTTAGTRVFDELGTGASIGSFGEHVLLPDGTLVACCWTPATGHAIYARAPGATRWTLLADPWPMENGEAVEHMAVWGTECWFLANDSTPHIELWRTDGTPGGTRLAEDVALAASRRDERVHEMLGSSSGLWITAGDSDRWLWWKAAANTPSVAVADSQGPIEAWSLWGSLAGRLVFVAPSARFGLEPWISDGTVAGTIPLQDIVPGWFQSGPKLLAVEPTRIWFSASSVNERNELWVTDGTVAGTRMVIDLAPGVANGIPGSGAAALPAFGGLVFVGFRPQVGTELFFTDGTAAGTRLLLDIRPGTAGCFPDSLFAARNRVWFRATDATSGKELWSTDGTAAGTRLELDVRPGSEDGAAEVIGDTTNGLVLVVDDPLTGIEPWRFDPTTGAASLLANLAVDPINGGSGIHHLTHHDAFAWFVASRNGTDFEAFATDGTLGATTSLPSPSVTDIDRIQPLGAVSAGLLFRVFVPTSGNELWITDGTATGTHRVLNLDNSSGNRVIQDVVAWNDGLWFLWSNGGGFGLWHTDGTAAGTGPAPGFPNGTAFRPRLGHAGWLWGVGNDAQHGNEPWRSDGTEAGTRRIADISPGTGDARAYWFTPLGDRVFFWATSPTGGSEPWVTDGTAAGTFQLADVVPGGSTFLHDVGVLDDRVVFLAQTVANGVEPWVTDGTLAGTRQLVETVPGADHQPPSDLRRAGDRLLFTVYPNRGSAAIWTTDGTPAGTVSLLGAATLGAAVLGSAYPMGDDGSFVFVADEATHGRELWASDGTLAGTRIVADSFSGQAPSEPTGFTRFRDAVLFEADDGLTGRELHRIPLADFGAAVASPIGRGCGAHLDAGGAPEIGRSFTLRIQASGGGPAGLVFDTAPSFGAPRPGCEIHLRNPTVLGNYATDAQGMASLPVQVPNDPALVGTLLYLQSVHLRSGGPLFGTLELTEGLELLVGR